LHALGDYRTIYITLSKTQTSPADENLCHLALEELDSLSKYAQFMSGKKGLPTTDGQDLKALKKSLKGTDHEGLLLQLEVILLLVYRFFLIKVSQRTGF
jgi:hypothetical protein